MGRKPKLIIEPHTSLRVDLPDDVNEFFRQQAESFNMSPKDYLIHLIRFRNPDKAELENLENELNQIKLREAEVTYAIKEKKIKIEQDKKLQEEILNQQKYAIASLRLLFDLIDTRGSDRKILIDPAIINQTYGIAFNIAKCYQNCDIVRELPNEELIPYLSLRKLENVKARKNVEILGVVRKKNRLEKE